MQKHSIHIYKVIHQECTAHLHVSGWPVQRVARWRHVAAKVEPDPRAP